MNKIKKLNKQTYRKLKILSKKAKVSKFTVKMSFIFIRSTIQMLYLRTKSHVTRALIRKDFI